MKKLKLLFRKDNRGSSMIVAIMAIAFVGILAVTVMTSTMANYKMKHINYKSKKTFYNAESAVDEIYSGLSSDCYKELNEAYMAMVSHLVNKDNSEVNTEIKYYYKKAVQEMLGGDKSFWKDETKLKEYFNSFIKDTDNASVISVNTADVNVESFPFYIPDVTVQYRERATDDFSKVTVDLNINFPNVRFDLIDDKNNLKTYLNFAMIGMTGIRIQSDVSIAGGMYAGHRYLTENNQNGGLQIEAGRTQLVKGTSDTLVIADDVVSVRGELSLWNGHIWTENINVGSDVYSTRGIFGMTNDSAVYVKDDLTLSHNLSKAYLNGEYWGYGTGNDSSGNKNSSAIILNGVNSVIYNMDKGMNKFVLGGNAYIKDTGYMMGDSLGVKGFQKMYLVPSEYMTMSNPYNANKLNGKTPVDYTKIKSFFAYKAGWLSTDESGEAVVELLSPSSGDNSSVYCYLKFKDEDARYKFIECIYSGTYQDDYGNTVNVKSDPVWKELNSVYKTSVRKFMQIESRFTSSGVNSAGLTYDVDYFHNPSDNHIQIPNYIPLPGIVRESCAKKALRYDVLKLFLYDYYDNEDCEVEITDTSKPISKVTIYDEGGSKDHFVADVDNFYDYVIDIDQFTEGKKEDEEGNVEYSHALDPSKVSEIIKAALDDGYKVDGDENGCLIYKEGGENTVVLALGRDYKLMSGPGQGVVLAYNGDVEVATGFKGLVMTNKNIQVRTNNQTLSADKELVAKVISENSILSRFFKGFQQQSEGLDPENIAMEDLLQFSNWRKNYENEVETGTEE